MLVAGQYQEIGRGAQGRAIRLWLDDGPTWVLKYVNRTLTADFIYEVEAMRFLENHGVEGVQ